MGRYLDADLVTKSLIGSSAKTPRGFGKFYDTLISSLDSDPVAMMEIGIGAVHSHVTWSNVFPNSTIIGLDVASPIVELCAVQECHIRQYQNALTGINNFCQLPIKNRKNIQLHYNRNAYDAAIVNEVVEAYGQLDLIIDDGKQTSWIHNQLLQLYKDVLSDSGLLIKEKIGRNGQNNVDAVQMQKAIMNGWIIYDIREYVKFENPESAGFMGIWAKDASKYIEIFKDFKRVVDVENHSPALAHLPQDSMQLTQQEE